MSTKWGGDRYVRLPKVKRIAFRDPTKCYRCQRPVVGPPDPRCTAEVIHTEPKKPPEPKG